jgi:hypothetical protein
MIRFSASGTNLLSSCSLRRRLTISSNLSATMLEDDAVILMSIITRFKVSFVDVIEANVLLGWLKMEIAFVNILEAADFDFLEFSRIGFILF